MTEIKVGDRVRYNPDVRNGFREYGTTGTIVSIMPPVTPEDSPDYAKDPFFGRIRWDKKGSPLDDLVYPDEIELLDD